MEADTQAQIARRDGFGHERAYEGETNDWITPRWILDAFGPNYFDLDPCASATQPWPTARRMYTIDDDGLLPGAFMDIAFYTNSSRGYRQLQAI